jgi:mannose-6-phosphate isomerase-like protein (cupin superfamily)
MDLKTIEKDWNSRGFSFGIWVDPPGQVWKDYQHETDELFMALEGDVELEIESRSMRLKHGEEILIPQGVLHTVRNLGKTQSRWLYGYRNK